jgi:hypothetical protein
MSDEEGYIKLQQAIVQNEQDTHTLINEFAKSDGELSFALNLDPQLNLTEFKFLEMALDTLRSARELVINLRMETGNKSTLINEIDRISGKTIPIMKGLTSEVRKAKAPQVKGGQFSPWRSHEVTILAVLKVYESDENRLKLSRDPSKLTQKKAIDEITNKTDQTVKESTFNTWLGKYRSKNCKIFSEDSNS